jgi:hypothetical protein
LEEKALQFAPIKYCEDTSPTQAQENVCWTQAANASITRAL